MKLLYPVDKDGDKIGGEQEFTDSAAAHILAMKNCRWREAEEEDDYYSNLKTMTKRQLVESFSLPNEDMLMTKAEIIKKITE